MLDKKADNVTDKVVDKVVDKLTKNQILILNLIENKNQISARELSIELGISHRKTQENIAKLKKIGLLKRVGSAKGGYWEIINEK
ncbi:MAG: winged helix-turn-helix transcriptional regulator [Bacteroidales bacterium]|jgi:ATP-dependent DNA helicase RecG|nr:winged helix-turn-helix transcriptional regulator [Bacteroidales bacterium]MDD2387806.1 winged helix-turn-helix transcriptional regulator [Bacteroidales bacterium]MDD4218534.1 winged helix-turn-helix transcriptional regulator [Bacteroidales bacterium]